MYEWYRDSSNWSISLSINGQPAFVAIDSAGQSWDITPFIIDGHNVVHVVAERDRRTSSQPADDMAYCRMSLAYLSFPDRKRVEIKNIVADDAASRIDERVEFEASVPVRWAWQDADPLTELTRQDRKAVMAILEDMAASLKRRSFIACQSKTIPWWGGPFVVQAAWMPVDPISQIEDSQRRIREVDKWEVSVADESRIEFACGSRLLRLTVPELVYDSLVDPPSTIRFLSPAAVIRAGIPADAPEEDTLNSYGVYMPTVFLLKCDGVWKVLSYDYYLPVQKLSPTETRPETKPATEKPNDANE